MNKFGAKKASIDGITFDSKREMLRYCELKMLQRAGKIRDLRLQVPIDLQGRDGPILTRTGRKAKYKADFIYFDNRLQAEVVEDSKGFVTKDYELKRAILAAQGIIIKEV